MRVAVSKELGERIATPIWEQYTIQNVLEHFLENDRETLEELVYQAFDEEFDLLYAPVISPKETVIIDLPDTIESLINQMKAVKSISSGQAATLILDVTQTYIINGKRMWG